MNERMVAVSILGRHKGCYTTEAKDFGTEQNDGHTVKANGGSDASARARVFDLYRNTRAGLLACGFSCFSFTKNKFVNENVFSFVVCLFVFQICLVVLRAIRLWFKVVHLRIRSSPFYCASIVMTP